VERCDHDFVAIAGRLKEPGPSEQAQYAVTQVRPTDAGGAAAWETDVLKCAATMLRTGVYEEDGFQRKVYRLELREPERRIKESFGYKAGLKKRTPKAILGFGRIVVSETEAPNLFVNLV
jgi:hypothetical protein